MTNLDDSSMTVEAWIDAYYRRDRLSSEPGRRERIIADRENDMRLYGEAIISRHESVTGVRVILYDPRWRPQSYFRWCVSAEDEP